MNRLLHIKQVTIPTLGTIAKIPWCKLLCLSVTLTFAFLFSVDNLSGQSNLNKQPAIDVAGVSNFSQNRSYNGFTYNFHESPKTSQFTITCPANYVVCLT